VRDGLRGMFHDVADVEVVGVARLQVVEPVWRVDVLGGLGDPGLVDAADVRDRTTHHYAGWIFTRFG
jgi:hypothetical protein